MLAFDTDLIGPYGVCVDISRTWLVGADNPSPAQKDLYERALEQVQNNISLLRPGISWEELVKRALVYPHETYRHYSVLYHGVGLCDEYPAVPYPHQWEDEVLEDGVKDGMVICVESYIGRRDGGEGVKYEEQVLITQTGVERLSTYPVDLVIC
jgi:Xaa-Pro aminopeptidase